MTHRSAILANLLLSLPMVTGLLGVAPSAKAQAADAAKMSATIPFDFSIGNNHLSAGSYSLERISDSFVAVRNRKTLNAVVLMVRRENGRGPSKAHLVFQRGGRGMYLTQAWFGGTNEYVGTAKLPSRDVEAKAGSQVPSSVEVASNR